MITRTITNNNNSDVIGALASGLCLIHCVATPLIFLAQTNTAHPDAPIWWKSIDYIFLVVSFFAVYWSSKNTSKSWVKNALWISWACLTLVILNEKLELFHLAESAIYLPALALVGLHIYNRKYCQCKNDDCCTPQ